MKLTAVALPFKVGGESTTAGEKKKAGSDGCGVVGHRFVKQMPASPASPNHRTQTAPEILP